MSISDRPATRRARHLRPARVGTAIASTTVLALALTSFSSQAAPTPKVATGEPGAVRGDTHSKELRNFDSRESGESGRVLDRRQQRFAAEPTAGVSRLRRSLGVQGVISIDPLTGTPRTVARLDGFLTGPSSRRPDVIATDYVSAHADVFGLDSNDLGTLRLRKSYTDITGTRHLSWLQYAGQVPLFGNGLKAHVARDGRLISVTGSPVRGVDPVAVTPEVSAGEARSAAIANVHGRAADVHATRAPGVTRPTTFSDGDRASLVAFHGTEGARLAWQTIVTGRGGRMYLHLVDAGSGRVLYRQNLTASDTGRVWEYWPGKPVGGQQRVVDLTSPGWLQQGSARLFGPNAHVWSDTNDDDQAQRHEEVHTGPNSYEFPFVDFTEIDGQPCSRFFPCSWDPETPGSWVRNRKQDAVQVFYFVNKFHDHLRRAQIGFTPAAGNFEGPDAVRAQPNDGANTGTGELAGLPDSRHVNNANMGTPPDGQPPRMQMFLFNDPADPEDPFLSVNGGDEADIVYHEYTHGLSNRLVVDAAGVSTLGDIQAGAMGEAWSDWYAMDFLNNIGVQADTTAPGEVKVGYYVDKGQNVIRSQPLDCPVGSLSAKCRGTTGAGPGGYTYGDYGRVGGTPEVHDDGEIWGETLWDLRRALGSTLSESLVTRAMELSPANPSFLDMRNSIVQADTVTNRGQARSTIWRVFAHRGMGYFAGAVNGDDAEPAEDFSMPPAANTPTGSLTGRVVDDVTREPIAGAAVAFGGHASGFPTDYADTTDRDGRYEITGIFAGTYPKVFAEAPGYDRKVRPVSVRAGTNARGWALRRDWAALSGGATVADTNDDTGGPFGCGAAAMFDQSQGNGWSALREIVDGRVVPKFVVVRLPSVVDVSEILIDPSNTCGDAGSASTGPYSLETSTDGTTWRLASRGTFTPADRGHFSSPALARRSTGDVRFVRYTMKDSQVLQVGSCPGAFSGCDFIDSRELEVFGSPDR
jgi:extracellular elastinolytic metalloproteinase